MLESKVYAEFVKCFGRVFEVERLENAIQPGTFDCTLSANNRTIWIEFKKSDQEKLRGTQVGWVLRRVRKGCYTDMLVVTVAPNQGFLVTLAADMATSDLRVCQAPRVLVSGSELEAFLATTFLIGEHDDGQRSYRQRDSDDNEPTTKH